MLNYDDKYVSIIRANLNLVDWSLQQNPHFPLDRKYLNISPSLRHVLLTSTVLEPNRFLVQEPQVTGPQEEVQIAQQLKVQKYHVSTFRFTPTQMPITHQANIQRREPGAMISATTIRGRTMHLQVDIGHTLQGARPVRPGGTSG